MAGTRNCPPHSPPAVVQLPHRRGARCPHTDMTETTRGHNVITQTIFKSLNAMAKVCIPRVGNLSPSRVPVLATSLKYIICGTELPMSVCGVGNGAIWAVNGTVLPLRHGIRKSVFQALRLLTNSTVAKSRLTVW